MSVEDWRAEENRGLEREREKLLDQEERENIWRNAFGNLSEDLTRLVRTKGIPAKVSDLYMPRNARGLGSSEQLFQFKRRLLIGACEYLESHPPADDRITAKELFRVLHSSKHFGNLVKREIIDRWIHSEKYSDILEDFAVDHSPHDTINARYAHAIRKWWKENPQKERLSYAGVGRIIKRLGDTVKKKIKSTDELRILAEKRPSDV